MSNLRVGMPGAGCQVGVASTSGHSGVARDGLLVLERHGAVRLLERLPAADGRRPAAERHLVIARAARTASASGGRRPGGFHFLCPSLSSFGRARTTSPRSISARSSIFGPWYDGSGGSRIATAVGSGAGPFAPACARPSRPGGGAGATSVLARTASGDFQPSASLAAWVAGAIRSGAGTILAASSAAGDAAWRRLAPATALVLRGGGLARRGGRRGWAGALSAGAASGWNSGLSSTRPCTWPWTPSAEPSSSSPVASTTRSRSTRSSTRKSCSRLSPSSTARVSRSMLRVVREHVQLLVDLQALRRPAIHPAGGRLAGQQILAAQVGLHRDHGPLFLRGQRSRRDGPPGRDHGRLVARVAGLGFGTFSGSSGGDHVLGRQLLEHAVLHPLVAGVALLVRQPPPHQVQAREDPERLEETILARRARTRCPSASRPFARSIRNGRSGCGLSGRLREDVRQPVVREIDDGQAVAPRVLGRRLAHDAASLDDAIGPWADAGIGHRSRWGRRGRLLRLCRLSAAGQKAGQRQGRRAAPRRANGGGASRGRVPWGFHQHEPKPRILAFATQAGACRTAAVPLAGGIMDR